MKKSTYIKFVYLKIPCLHFCLESGRGQPKELFLNVVDKYRQLLCILKSLQIFLVTYSKLCRNLSLQQNRVICEVRVTQEISCIYFCNGEDPHKSGIWDSCAFVNRYENRGRFYCISPYSLIEVSWLSHSHFNDEKTGAKGYQGLNQSSGSFLVSFRERLLHSYI